MEWIFLQSTYIFTEPHSELLLLFTVVYPVLTGGKIRTIALRLIGWSRTKFFGADCEIATV